GLVVLAFLGLLGSPFLHIRYGEPTYQILPEREPSRQGAEILDKYFPAYGKSSDVYIVAKTRNATKMTEPINSAALYDYATGLKTRFPQVQKVLAGGQDLLAMKEQFLQGLAVYGSNPALLDDQTKAFFAQIVNGDTASLKLLTNIEYSSQSA